jgi:hypothetical protein
MLAPYTTKAMKKKRTKKVQEAYNELSTKAQVLKSMN